MQETGTWCETTDSDMHFTVRSLHDIMGSPAFVGAAMALASRQLDYLEGCERQVTLELYQYTIQLLLRQNTAAPDPSVLAACTLLCVYEMMASEVHEWRRHLKVSLYLRDITPLKPYSQSIFRAVLVSCRPRSGTDLPRESSSHVSGHLHESVGEGPTPGNSVRIKGTEDEIIVDIWAAFITQNTTLIPTDFWLDDTSCKSVRTTGSIDDYCNLAILTFAKIVNLLALRSHRENECYSSASATSLLSLWDELQEWYQQRPPDVYPLLRDPCSSGKVFPTIIFSRASSSKSTRHPIIALRAYSCLASMREHLLPYWVHIASSDRRSHNRDSTLLFKRQGMWLAIMLLRVDVFGQDKLTYSSSFFRKTLFGTRASLPGSLCQTYHSKHASSRS